MMIFEFWVCLVNIGGVYFCMIPGPIDLMFKDSSLEYLGHWMIGWYTLIYPLPYRILLVVSVAITKGMRGTIFRLCMTPIFDYLLVNCCTWED